ncbi:MAG: hypothetical protein HUJ71_04135 [Pseudobutyrivibrio sp.]|nr:hypothetical protein [Pseudobutyrivibrio sp.]
MQTSFETDESVYYIDGKEVEEDEYNSHLEDNSKNIINLTLDDCTMVSTAEEIDTFLAQY